MAKETKILLVLVFIMLAVSYFSSAYSKKTETVGAFEITSYYEEPVFNWEASRNLYKVTVCSTVSDYCTEGDFGYLDNTPGRIVIISDDGHDTWYDKNTGQKLSCINCKSSTFLENACIPAGLRWYDNGTHAYGVYRKSCNYKIKEKYKIILIDVVEKGLKVTLIELNNSNSSYLRPRDLSYSPDRRYFAWYSCDPNCTLWKLDIARNIYSKLSTECPYNSYLDYTWYDGTPKPEFYWGATKKDMCLDKDGNPFFPKAKKKW